MNPQDPNTVNATVNCFPYTSDATRYGQADFWARADGVGEDCEDFALGKLKRLIDLGWPISALRLACCYVETGEYHAVLVVRSGSNDLVLDNRQNHPCTLDELDRIGYKPDRIQTTGGSQEWSKWEWTQEGA